MRIRKFVYQPGDRRQICNLCGQEWLRSECTPIQGNYYCPTCAPLKEGDIMNRKRAIPTRGGIND